MLKLILNRGIVICRSAQCHLHHPSFEIHLCTYIMDDLPLQILQEFCLPQNLLGVCRKLMILLFLALGIGFAEKSLSHLLSPIALFLWLFYFVYLHIDLDMKLRPVFAIILQVINHTLEHSTGMYLCHALESLTCLPLNASHSLQRQ